MEEDAVLHEIDPLTLDRLGQDDNWFSAGRPGGGQGLVQGLHVMAIDVQNLPAKGPPLIGQGFQGHDILGKAIDHEPVSVDNGDQIVKLEMGSRHGGLPDTALTAFAIAQEYHRPEVFFLVTGTQGHAYAQGQAVPQGAGRGVATDNLVAIGVHGEGAAEMIEGLQQFLVKITAFGQGGNQAGRCMSLGQDEAVTVLPVRLIGPDPQMLKIKDGQYVCDAERTPNVGATRPGHDVDHAKSKVTCQIFQLRFLFRCKYHESPSLIRG